MCVCGLKKNRHNCKTISLSPRFESIEKKKLLLLIITNYYCFNTRFKVTIFLNKYFASKYKIKNTNFYLKYNILKRYKKKKKLDYFVKMLYTKIV